MPVATILENLEAGASLDDVLASAGPHADRFRLSSNSLREASDLASAEH